MDLKEEKATDRSPGLKAARATSTYILSVRTLSHGLMDLHTEVGNVDSEPQAGRGTDLGETDGILLHISQGQLF